MVRFLSVSIVTLILAHAGFSETWITVNNKARRLKKNTSCLKISRSSQRIACDCCLVKNSSVRNMNSLDSLMACERSLDCKYDQSAEQDELVAREEVRQSYSRLRAMSIIDIDQLSLAPQLPADGVLLEHHVLDILRSLNQSGHLMLPNNIDQTLNIKQLGDSAKGFYSGQLFAIRYANQTSQEFSQDLKPLYILKETKKGVREIGNLYRINSSKLSAEKISTIDLMNKPVSNVDMARISFDDLHFKLKTQGKTRYFSLLQTAPGQSLRGYLKEFGKIARSIDIDNQEFQSSYSKMKHIFYRVGFAVSKLHQKYAVTNSKRSFTDQHTFVHGDMHSENIFYDDKTDMVTLIDNETFSLSLNRTISGVNDIVEFYMVHTIHTVAQKFSDQLTINTEFGIDDRLWHELCRSLFNGYLSAYEATSQDDYDKLYAGFRARFLAGFSVRSVFSSPRNIADQRKLKRIGPSSRRRHIEKNELMQTMDRLYSDGIKKYQ